MLQKLSAILFLGLVIVLVAPRSSAQTLSDLKNKYGRPDKTGHYIVRKGVLLTVRSDKGRVTQMKIEPEGSKSQEAGATNFLPEPTVNEILDELAPVARRGKHIRSIVFNAGCSSVAAEEYDRVTISTSSAECPGKGGITKSGITAANVRWKI